MQNPVSGVLFLPFHDYNHIMTCIRRLKTDTFASGEYEMNLTEILAEYAKDLTFDDIPESVIEVQKQSLADALSCMAAAACCLFFNFLFAIINTILGKMFAFQIYPSI